MSSKSSRFTKESYVTTHFEKWCTCEICIILFGYKLHRIAATLTILSCDYVCSKVTSLKWSLFGEKNRIKWCTINWTVLISPPRSPWRCICNLNGNRNPKLVIYTYFLTVRLSVLIIGNVNVTSYNALWNIFQSAITWYQI